jgi:FO synthase
LRLLHVRACPRELPAAYLELDEILAIAHRGAQLGCHEALFTLGERPELRYSEARSWLTTGTAPRGLPRVGLPRGAHQTGLLPHANAGALHRDELAAMREVTASQGMMIESLRPDLAAHRGAPDKQPDRRLATRAPRVNWRSRSLPGSWSASATPRPTA